MKPKTRVRGSFVSLGAAWLLVTLTATALDPSRATTQYHRTVWTAQQGLPGNSVNWLAQDAAGYLIVGVFGGAVTFDGARFRPLAGTSEDPPRIYVRTENGTEWLAGTGLARRGPDGLVEVVTPLGDFSQPMAVFADDDGTLMLGGKAGIARLSPESTSLEKDPHLEGPVRAILRRRAGTLVAAGRDGLYEQGTDGQWTVIAGTEDATVGTLIEARDGTLWLGTYSGIMVVHGDGRIARHDRVNGQPAGRVRALIEDRDGNVWAGLATHGLVRINGDRIDPLSVDGGLPSASIRALHEDNDGNLWVGTAGGGLVRLADGRFVGIGTREGLRSDFVFNILRAQGDLWVGTNGGGLSRFRDGVHVRTYGPGDGLTNPVVQATLETRDGRLFAATRDGVYMLDGSRFREVKSLVGLDCRYLEEGADGSVLLGTSRGLARWDGDSQLVVFDGPQAVEDIRTIEPARGRGFWVGGIGLGLYDGKEVERLHAERIADVVRDIHEDSDGVLWVATKPGLVRIEGDQIKPYPMPPAIDRVVHAIVPDNQRRLWLPTNDGLVRAERVELDAFARGERTTIDWIVFNESDGLPGGEFNGSFGRPWARERDGRLWFSSVAGVVSIDPGAPFTPAAIPARLELALTDDEQPVRHGATLSPHQRSRLAFHYTAISLSTLEPIRFRYRLDPLDESWVDAGHSRDAIYHNLPPGTYRFRVEAAGRDGVFSGDPRPFQISIEPYLHERATVRISAAMLLIGLAVGVVLLRERRMGLRQAEQERLVEVRTKELMKTRAELELVSRIDTLTGLLNRRDFDDRAEHEIARVNRGHGAFSVILVDVDQFKQINDRFGHATGDLLLAHVAGVLVERTRRQDVVGRWAGEEFILLLPDTTIDGAALLADKIRWSIEHGDYSAYGGPESLTATFGVTTFQTGETLEEAIHRADLALDEGKSLGRNRVVRRLAGDDEPHPTASGD